MPLSVMMTLSDTNLSTDVWADPCAQIHVDGVRPWCVPGMPTIVPVWS